MSSGLEGLSYKERVFFLLEVGGVREDLEVYKIMRGVYKVNSHCHFPRVANLKVDGKCLKGTRGITF